MPIYTRGGDTGGTGTLAGTRVRKDSPILDANGTLDELVAQLGVVRVLLASPDQQEWARFIHAVQKDLFLLGAYVSSADSSYLANMLVTPQQMEQGIDRLFAGTVLTAFVIPGETRLDAHCHVARTVCRRAERSLVALDSHEGVAAILPWVNRLSDFLFALAWRASQRA